MINKKWSLEWAFKWAIGVIFGYAKGNLSLKIARGMLKKAIKLGLKRETVNLLIDMISIYTKKNLEVLKDVQA
ncbi:MAG: hypothetical protein DRJ69_07225 [Thermoprotei archaeon]|nr:MAG: hypothetical protein DRJ69_07225 [Thermoprotei archaeon]